MCPNSGSALVSGWGPLEMDLINIATAYGKICIVFPPAVPLYILSLYERKRKPEKKKKGKRKIL